MAFNQCYSGITLDREGVATRGDKMHRWMEGTLLPIIVLRSDEYMVTGFGSTYPSLNGAHIKFLDRTVERNDSGKVTRKHKIHWWIVECDGLIFTLWLGHFPPLLINESVSYYLVYGGVTISFPGPKPTDVGAGCQIFGGVCPVFALSKKIQLVMMCISVLYQCWMMQNYKRKRQSTVPHRNLRSCRNFEEH